MPSTSLLSAITTVSTGSAVVIPAGPKVIRAKLTGTGTISATINIYGSTENSTSNGVLLGTLSPSGTTSAVDSITMDAPWPYIWADQTAISGTGAATTVDVGY
jgi:hypothetical protein